MTTYHSFSRSNRRTLESDVDFARDLSMSCVNSLIYRPSGPTIRTMQLLADTFRIPVSDWHDDEDEDEGWRKIDPIKNRLFSFGGRIGRTRLEYDASAPTTGEMDNAAYVRSDNANTIFVRGSFFDMSQQKSRAATLIHEYIHLVQRAGGHPGGVRLMLGRGAMDIPYEQAIENPYCYQYYAEWL